MMRMTTKENLTQLEQYFQQFRKNIIGINQELSVRAKTNYLYGLDSQWSFIPSY
jgi:hypothetical protein